MVQTNPAKKKSTFVISEDLLSEMKEMISASGLRSQNAFIEEAIKEYIDKTRREMRRQSYLEAIRDPLFLKDIEDVERDFKDADAEAARMIQ